MSAIVEIEDLRVTRAAATICRLPRLAIEAGERVAVTGSNGSGKTTLLRLLAGLEVEHAGRCTVRVEQRRRALIAQKPLLFRGTVLSNVTYGLRARGRRGAEGERLGRAWLERFDIGALAERDARTLSGGETRRVALARALVLEPELVLLDEPLADLDRDGEAQLREVLAGIEATVVIASPTPPPDGLVQRVHAL